MALVVLVLVLMAVAAVALHRAYVTPRGTHHLEPYDEARPPLPTRTWWPEPETRPC